MTVLSSEREQHHTSVVESILREEFKAVLECPDIPPDVLFWELGGTSLGLIGALARTAKRLGVRIPVSELLAEPTVSSIARWVTRNAAPIEGEPAPVRRLPALPRACLLRQLIDPGDLASTCLLLWDLQGLVDHDRLATAFHAMVWRHDALRSSYSLTGLPEALPEDALAVLTRFRAPDAETAKSDVLNRLLVPLNPRAGEVVRGTLAEISLDRNLLGIAVHHVAFDGWSEHLIASELSSLYEDPAGPADVPAPLPLGEAYALQFAHSASEVAARTKRATAFLRDAPDLRISSLPEQASAAAVSARHTQPGSSARLRVVAAARGVSYFTLLVSAYARALATVSGESDFTIGVPLSRRVDHRIERVIGNFVEMIPIRFRIRPGAPLDADVRDAAEAVAQAFGCQEAEFEKVPMTGGDRGGAGRLYRHVFALQDTVHPSLRLPGVDARFIRSDFAQLATETMCEVWPASADEGTAEDRISFWHSTDAVDSGTATRITDAFVSRLRLLSGTTAT